MDFHRIGRRGLVFSGSGQAGACECSDERPVRKIRGMSQPAEDLIFKILISADIPTNVLYYSVKLLQLKHRNYGMVQPYFVARPEGEYIDICMKCRL
jgi:hypothetical protein